MSAQPDWLEDEKAELSGPPWFYVLLDEPGARLLAKGIVSQNLLAQAAHLVACVYDETAGLRTKSAPRQTLKRPRC